MPPPRLIRPPRPCQPIWSPFQVRYASGGANNNSPGGRDDQMPSSHSRNLGSTPASKTTQSIESEQTPGRSTPKSGWWGAVLGGITTWAEGRSTPQATEPLARDVGMGQPNVERPVLSRQAAAMRERLTTGEDSGPSSPSSEEPLLRRTESAPPLAGSVELSEAGESVRQVDGEGRQSGQVFGLPKRLQPKSSIALKTQEGIQADGLPAVRKILDRSTSLIKKEKFLLLKLKTGHPPTREAQDSQDMQKTSIKTRLGKPEGAVADKASITPPIRKYNGAPSSAREKKFAGVMQKIQQRSPDARTEKTEWEILNTEPLIRNKITATDTPLVESFTHAEAQHVSTRNTPSVREVGTTSSRDASENSHRQKPSIVHQHGNSEDKLTGGQAHRKNKPSVKQTTATSTVTSAPSAHKPEDDDSSEIKQMLQHLMLEVQSLRAKLSQLDPADGATTKAEQIRQESSGQENAVSTPTLVEERVLSTPVEQVSEAVTAAQQNSKRRVRAIHTQANGMRAADHSNDIKQKSKKAPDQRISLMEQVVEVQEKAKATKTDSTDAKSQDTVDPPPSPEQSEQSLLEELFPEINMAFEPKAPLRRAPKTYPKLDLPSDVSPGVQNTQLPPLSPRKQMIAAFQSRAHAVTVLQLSHCSTELTEQDFRHIIPKGKHIESWQRSGEYYKIIPGRDPLSLERMPFYYLLFKTMEAALEYQNNAARLHALSSLHQPSSMLSPIPPPKGLLEDGEDINFATTSYTLAPRNLSLTLRIVMQPYNSHLLSLIDLGGYKPIVPCVDPATGKPVHRVLMSIAGWEPDPLDLYKMLNQHAQSLGFMWPYANGAKSIHRLRSLSSFAKHQGSSSSSAFSPASASSLNPSLSTHKDSHATDSAAGKEQALHQIIMTQLYNRWIIDFTEEGAARRFARMWHRRVLPPPRFTTWKDVEEVRMCSVEYLW